MKSLSNAEKSYFKKFALLNLSSKGTSNHVLLFDLIDNQDPYDETSIKAGLKTHHVKTDLKTLKVYLEKLIYKSMAIYHSDSTHQNKVKADLSEIEFALHKGLADIALSKVKKLKKFCLQHEYYYPLMRCCNLQQHAQPEYYQNNEEAALELANEVQLYSDRYLNNWNLIQLHNSVLRITKNSRLEPHEIPESDRKKLRAILKHDLLQTEDRALTNSNKCVFHLALSHIYYALGTRHDKKQLYHSQRMMSLMEENKESNFSKNYVVALLNHLATLYRVGVYTEYLRYSKIATQYGLENPEIKPYMLLVYAQETEMNNSNGKFIESIQLYEENLALMTSKTDAAYGPVVYNSTQLLLAVAHYALRNYRKAAEHLSLMELTSTDRLTAEDYRMHFESRLLHIVLSLSKEKFDLAESQIRSLTRWSKQHRSDLLNSQLITSALNRIIGTPTSDQLEIYKTLESQLFDEKYAGNLLEFKYFLFDKWVEAIATNKSYAETMVRKI